VRFSATNTHQSCKASKLNQISSVYDAVSPTGLARREGSDVRDIARAGLARIAGATKLTALAALAVAGALAMPAMAAAATVPAPTIATSFTPNQIDVTGSSSVQYSINVSSGTVNNVTFTDTLPAGVVLDNPATETDAGCTSSTVSAPIVTYTATPGASTITVSIPQVKAGTPCTVQFPVVGNAVGNGSDSFAPGSFTYATSATGAATPAPASGETTASIQVIPQPTVTVRGLKAGAKYKFGQAVAVKYTCAQPGLTDGIVVCAANDDLGHNVKSGAKLRTTTPGKHALTFQVVDALGDVVSNEIDYTVMPDNRFTIDRVTRHSGGTLGFTLALPGPGAVAIKELVAGKLVSSKTVKTHAKVKLAETMKLDAAGRKLLSDGNIKVKLQVSYRPTGGTKSTVAKGGIALGG
jgi:hypothetical protein